MTITFSPTASQFGTLQYAWYGPVNQSMANNQDSTTLAFGFGSYSPFNYAPPWNLPVITYPAYNMLLMF